MISLLSAEEYQGAAVSFRTADGYVNATEMAKAVAPGRLSKIPTHFLRLDSTRRFINALTDDLGKLGNLNLPTAKLVEVRHGGIAAGTWMHPDLALEFARWLSPEFAIWTNRVIRRVLAGQALSESAPQQVSAQLSRIIDLLTTVTESLERRVTSLEDFVTAPKKRLRLVATGVRHGGRPRIHHLADYLPKMRAIAGGVEARRGFGDFARALGMPNWHGTFDRLLREGRAEGSVQRHEDGRYYAVQSSGVEVCP